MERFTFHGLKTGLSVNVGRYILASRVSPFWLYLSGASDRTNGPRLCYVKFDVVEPNVPTRFEGHHSSSIEST